MTTSGSTNALQSRAKSRILRWLDAQSPPAKLRATMSRSIDCMFDELAKRADWFEVMTVSLGNTSDLNLELRSRTWRAFPCADSLVVTTVVPGWAKGWSQILRDEYSYDTLTWFLHYARQYLHRSHVAKLLMVAWDHDQRTLHPFGEQIQFQQYNSFWPATTVPKMLDTAERRALIEWGEPETRNRIRSTWASVNTVDPNIHQAIFHFIRAHALRDHSFELEAVVAFDCVLQAIKSLLVRCGLATSKTTRAEICRTLGLGLKDSAIATEAHFLRNNIGAHAGGWRWWDYGELTEGLVPALSALTRRALAKAAKLEPTIRTVEPEPQSWFDWLLRNFDMLWDVVWFEKLHQSKSA